MLFQIVLAALAAPRVLAEDAGTQLSSITTIITNSNLGSDFSVNTDSKKKSKTTSTTSLSSTTTVPPSYTTEDDDDKSIYKFIFTENTDYYDMGVKVDEQSMDVRLDILQNGLWVLNGDDVLECEEVNEWWSSEVQRYGSDDSNLPAEITTASEYTVSLCADGGVFTTDGASHEIPPSTVDGYENLNDFMVPCIDSINATGVIYTGNVTVSNANSEQLTFKRMSFINVNSSNVYIGGFGLAGNTIASAGVLDNLVKEGVIDSNGYSLYFNDFNDSGVGYAQVLPGLVDKKYYVGQLYKYDMLPNVGNRFPQKEYAFENELLQNMVLPSVELTDISMENVNNGATLSMSSGSSACLFDTRTVFNFLPLDTIINFAIQTNAFYNADANRWIVECDTIRDTHAVVTVKFSNLTIDVPIEDFLINATYNGQLKFSNGKDACYLTLLPTADPFVTLGLSVLKSIYLVVDNAGGTIGMALANKDLNINQDTYVPVSFEHDFDIDHLYNGSDVDTIAAIKSNSIPFASSVKGNDNLSLDYSSSNEDSTLLDIPARFSGVVISSGEVFITMTGTVTSSESGVATAASESKNSKSKGSAASSKNIVLTEYRGMNLLGVMVLIMTPTILFLL